LKKHTYSVGDWARSVESNWLGRIVELKDEPIIIDHDMPPIPQVMAKMEGVDGLVMTITGEPREKCISPDDIQWFSTDDLIPE
jgi:hypothetical protein